MDNMPREGSPSLQDVLRQRIYRLQGKQFVHMLHIGKTGGTAMKAALQKQPVTRRYVIFLHPHRIRLRDIPEGEQVFFFLRDPLSRFVSGFYSRQRQGRPRIFSPWSAEEAGAFGIFHSPSELGLALSSGSRVKKAAAERAMRGIQHVRDSFWYWFENEAYLVERKGDIFFIGRQENLAVDFDTLKNKLGLTPGLALPSDDLTAHRNPADLDTHLEEEAIRNLKAWYGRDYQFLEFCPSVFDFPSASGEWTAANAS
jgi:Sulfotransferase family